MLKHRAPAIGTRTASRWRAVVQPAHTWTLPARQVAALANNQTHRPMSVRTAHLANASKVIKNERNDEADEREDTVAEHWTGKLGRAACISIATCLILYGSASPWPTHSQASTCAPCPHTLMQPNTQQTAPTTSQSSATCAPANACTPSPAEPTATVAFQALPSQFSVTDRFGRFLLVEWVFGESDLLDLLQSWSWDFDVLRNRDNSPINRLGSLTKTTAPAPPGGANTQHQQQQQQAPSLTQTLPIPVNQQLTTPPSPPTITTLTDSTATSPSLIPPSSSSSSSSSSSILTVSAPSSSTTSSSGSSVIIPESPKDPIILDAPQLPSLDTKITIAPPPDPPPASTSSSAAAASRSALATLISEEEALSLPPPPTQFPDLPPLATPEFQQVTLSNGLRVVLLEDHEVPLVRGSIVMRGGMHASPPDKVGLASISMAVQRAGGSLLHPGSTLDLRLEELAAAVETGAGPQALTVDFVCASDDLKELLGLWSEVLRQPALPKDKLVLYQDQVLNSIEHRNDDATTVARRSLAKLMYGPSSIYARQPTTKGVTSITVDDIKDFLDTWERPDTAILGLVGDFTPSTITPVLEELLGTWSPAPGQPQDPPKLVKQENVLAPAEQFKSKVFVVDRPGLSQASVATSEPGISLTDPDAYALDVLSTSLNSFGGQLFDEIRSREGLAYSVFGAWDLPPDRPGTFLGGGETSSPGAFIQGLRRVLQQSTQVAPSTETLNDAKSEALNAFVFNFSSKSAQMQRRLVYELLELPSDLLFQYRDGVSRVTVEDVLGAAQRHLHPDQQVTVVVGDAKSVVPDLEAAGLTVTPLSLDDENGSGNA